MSTNTPTVHLATICVAQARGSTGAKAALKKLAAVSTWKRRNFIEKPEWAIMPGSESDQSSVADLCATKLLET